jgi:SAM-dependent methyltransferase
MTGDAIITHDDLFRMLDSWFRDNAAFWDRFYADREKGVPFFINAPDESLVAQVTDGRIAPGRVLELGCGPGRNALYLAGQGFTVDAVDLSPVAIRWAEERMAAAGVAVNFICASIFDFPVTAGSYDLVYDSGCLHHLAPHRRLSYLELVTRALKPGGLLGLTCFNEQMGYAGSEWELYRDGSMHGGLRAC